MGDCADFIKSLQTTTAQANDEEQLSLVATETKAHSAAKGGGGMVKRGRMKKKAVMLKRAGTERERMVRSAVEVARDFLILHSVC